MNMFQLQERIKDFSKDQLVREMQQPSGAVPPFLVLSELQRRTRMEKAFQAEQAQGQQSTVAQDAIAAAGVPQGGIADMAQAMAPQTDMAGNTGAMPVQNMYGGGEVKRMEPGGEVEGPNTAALRAIMEAQNTIRGMQARNRAMQVMLNRANGIAGLETVDTDLNSFRPTPAPREEARPRGYTPPMTLPSVTSLDPLSTAETPQIAVTGDSSAAPRLVSRDGEQFAEMPDGSLIPLEDLGISPAELAGADTADLAARPGFAGRDLASERMGAGFDTVGGLGAPMLSSVDRTSFGADTAVGGSRTAPTLGAVDRETTPQADILRPPSIDYIESMTDALPSEPPPSGYALSRFMFPGRDPAAEWLRLLEDEQTSVVEPTVATDEFSGLGPDMVPKGTADVVELPPLQGPNLPPGGMPAPSKTPPGGPRTSDTGGTGGAGARSTGAADADKWLALAQFGLGLMASQAPTLGGAIGEAGTMALGQLRESQKEAYERDLAERTLAARSARDRGLSASNLISIRSDLIEQYNNLTDGLGGEPTAADLDAAKQIKNQLAGIDRLLNLDALGGLGAVSADSSTYRLPSATP